MKLVAQPAIVGARGIDTIAQITPTYAAWLKAHGFDFVCRYLGSVTPDELAGIVRAGLAFMPVSYANRYNGPQAVAALYALGLPLGVTAWCDVEGVDLDAASLISILNSRASTVRSAGYDPGGYFGAGQLLTSEEQGALVLDRYWESCSDVVDRFNKPARPRTASGPIGWCMQQLSPGNLIRGGVEVDIDVIREDFRGRTPTWCVGVP